MRMQCQENMSIISVPHQKKTFCHIYRWHTHNWWEITLNPIVSSNDMTYETWLAEEHNRYMIYIITYPPSGVRAFNATRTAQRTSRERIRVLRK
jgi:hypothetical protein